MRSVGTVRAFGAVITKPLHPLTGAMNLAPLVVSQAPSVDAAGDVPSVDVPSVDVPSVGASVDAPALDVAVGAPTASVELPGERKRGS